MSSRSLRPRPASQYVNQVEWDLDEDDFILERRYNALERFKEYEAKGDLGLVQEMKGEDFTLAWIQEHGLMTPIVFRDSAGLGMKMPPRDFSVADVKRLVGPKREVDVMDTHTQKAITMTMAEWVKYYQSLPRKRVLNIISLEFSCTKMADLVEPPTVVSELDWVEGVWPREMKAKQSDPTNDMRRMMYPKVQKYCLMSVAGCYTDFHIDFGGTSVWYHLIRGEKLFLLIPPSEQAYEMFHIWQLSGEQEVLFFADLIEQAQLVRLSAGDTFIMPSGWIHAVYTPSDSLVFGGNFLHSFNIPQQLAVAVMESRTKVPTKFRYPFYGSIHWYTIAKYSEGLAHMGIKPNTDGNEIVDDQGSANKRKPRWLKEVSVERMSVSHSNDDSASSTSSQDNLTSSQLHQSTPPSSQDPLRQSQQSLHQDITTDDDLKSTTQITRQAYISTIEIEGLLMLLKKIEEEQLFTLDIPPRMLKPFLLVSQLVSQLKSSCLQSILSSRPTGVSLLQQSHKRTPATVSKLQSRKRQGKHLNVTAKLSRIDSECICYNKPCGTNVHVSSATNAETSVVKSTSSEKENCYEQCVSEQSMASLQESNLTPMKQQKFQKLTDPTQCDVSDSPALPHCVTTDSCAAECYSTITDLKPAQTELQSPVYSSSDLFTPPSPAAENDQIRLSELTPPGSPFTLQLPASPTTPPHNKSTLTTHH